MIKDIIKACTLYQVDLTKVNSNTENMIRQDFTLSNDDQIIQMRGDEILAYDVDTSAINYDTADFDEYLLQDTLYGYVDKYPYYLVIASGCTWNGASGYKFCKKVEDTVYRNYDVSIGIKFSIKHKAIICTESSHDVPLGSETIIVGLTEKEFNELQNADFSVIEEFISTYKE